MVTDFKLINKRKYKIEPNVINASPIPLFLTKHIFITAELWKYLWIFIKYYLFSPSESLE